MVHKFCIDPIERHKVKVKKNLRNVNAALSKKCEGKLKEGSLICINCIKLLNKDPALLFKCIPEEDCLSTSSSQSMTSLDNEEPYMSDQLADMEIAGAQAATSLKPLIEILQETPIKKKGLQKSTLRNKGSAKLEKLTCGIKRNLELLYGTEIPEPEHLEKEANERELNGYRMLMNELKTEFQNTTNYRRKIQILSLSPFTISETTEKFQASHRLVKASRNMKKTYGILPEVPIMSKGKVITEAIKNKVRSYYNLDDVSRNCPGKKDCLRVRNENGEKETKQKRLLLGNLKEIYQNYKDDPTNPKIGFNAFASLRPPYCILAGQGGTHSVCVCTYHQNPKLQVAALGEKNLTYKQLMANAVCDVEKEDCMMQRCRDCPKEEGVRTFLETLNCVEEGPDEIRYKKWITVDRCTMEEKVEHMDDFLSSLSENIVKLTRHHYIAKKQMEFFKSLKESLPSNEGLVVGDFSENYSFIIQDAAQGYHWDNSQCTVHPFVFYWIPVNEESPSHVSFCFLSDAVKHSTSMVHVFLKRLIPELRIVHPNLTKIHYFSDGCAGQYKNRFNFVNICWHKSDFELDCEWHFFATSHGKNVCDGIGGTVKRATERASIQRCTENQIQTPKDMFKFCNEKLSNNIKYLFVSEEEVKFGTEALKNRFENTITIPGTQTYHRFCPLNKDELLAYPISSTNNGQIKQITKTQRSIETINILFQELKVGQYVGCIYDGNLWFGLIEEVHTGYNDCTINFLHPSKNLSYSFPSKKDSCKVHIDNTVGLMSVPLIKPGVKVNYSFEESEVKKCIYTMKLKIKS